MSASDTRQALAALALGILPADEARLVDDAAREDAELARELRDYRATVRTLERVLPREPGPPHALHEVLAEVGRGARRPWRLPAIRLRTLAVAGASAVLLVGLVGIVASRGGPDADARASLVAAARGPIHGTAELHRTSESDARLVLRLEDVPAPPKGYHYEVWVLRVGADEMEAVGVFWARGDVEREFSLPGAGRYAAVDISVEEDAGEPEHSGRSLAGGAFA